MKIYIAGPMTGLPNLNYDAFHDAAARLRAAGYEVASPAETDERSDAHDWQGWMRLGITKLMGCTAVALLDGWERSRGARIEEDLAQHLGFDIRPVEEWLSANTLAETRIPEAIS